MSDVFDLAFAQSTFVVVFYRYVIFPVSTIDQIFGTDFSFLYGTHILQNVTRCVCSLTILLMQFGQCFGLKTKLSSAHSHEVVYFQKSQILFSELFVSSV